MDNRKACFANLSHCRVLSGRWVVGGSLPPHCVSCVGLLRFNLFEVVENNIQILNYSLIF